MGRPGSGRRRNEDREQRDREVVRLRKEGLSLREIGRRFGIGPTAVVGALERQGYVEPPRLKGFAAMTAEQRRRIGSMGGKAAHAKGAAHQFDHVEAVEAGKKGGKAAHERGTAHRFSSAEARAAGRKGGRGKRRKKA